MISTSANCIAASWSVPIFTIADITAYVVGTSCCLTITLSKAAFVFICNDNDIIQTVLGCFVTIINRGWFDSDNSVREICYGQLSTIIIILDLIDTCSSTSRAHEKAVNIMQTNVWRNSKYKCWKYSTK